MARDAEQVSGDQDDKASSIFADLPNATAGEEFTPLLERAGLKIERIVSQGQVTPEDAPYQQDQDEWVIVLSGHARVRIEGRDEVALHPGDHLLIPCGTRHWVTYTDPQAPTVWLAVHFG